MSGEFRGANVLVTGGAAGLGAAVAEMAAREGAAVAILDVDEAKGQETAQRVGGRFWRCDVSDPGAWNAVANAIYAELGPIHYAHLNAGIMSARPSDPLEAAQIDRLSPDRYRRMIATNIDGVFFGIQALLPRMIEGGGHCITVTSSAAGLVPLPFDPVYALTKHALVGLVRSVAAAFAQASVRLNAICPGGFDTALVPDAIRRGGADLMTPAEMAAEVLDLLVAGANGEIRLKLSRDVAAEAVVAPDLALG